MARVVIAARRLHDAVGPVPCHVPRVIVVRHTGRYWHWPSTGTGPALARQWHWPGTGPALSRGAQETDHRGMYVQRQLQRTDRLQALTHSLASSDPLWGLGLSTAGYPTYLESLKYPQRLSTCSAREQQSA